MYRVKPNLRNFERCQKLLAEKASQTISIRQLHSFIGWADKNTLRMNCHFESFQQMMGQVAGQLVRDKFVSNNQMMMSKTTAIFRHLNYYSAEWMRHTADITLNWLSLNSFLELDLLVQIYKSYIELDSYQNERFMLQIRKEIIAKVKKQIIKIDQNLEDQKIRKVQNLHKYLRSYLLDRNADYSRLVPVLRQLSDLFENHKLSINSFQNYKYNHTAFFYELLQLRLLTQKLSEGRYLIFLKKSYQINQHKVSKDKSQNSTSKFQRRGESVFQIRFQRHLQNSGYWFERNVRVGLSEYDILIKGKLTQFFRPFSQINLQQLRKGKSPPIHKQKLAQYEDMTGLWNLKTKLKWEIPMIVNLNGPFHYIKGDKNGLVRHEEIKREMLKHYGYPLFKTVDFRVWEKETINQKGVRDYFDKHLKP